MPIIREKYRSIHISPMLILTFKRLENSQNYMICIPVGFHRTLANETHVCYAGGLYQPSLASFKLVVLITVRC